MEICSQKSMHSSFLQESPSLCSYELATNSKCVGVGLLTAWIRQSLKVEKIIRHNSEFYSQNISNKIFQSLKLMRARRLKKIRGHNAKVYSDFERRTLKDVSTFLFIEGLKLNLVVWEITLQLLNNEKLTHLCRLHFCPISVTLICIQVTIS